MANKISFIAGEDLVAGRVVKVQSDDSVVYADSPLTEQPNGITFEPASSGSYVTVYAPGSVQVPMTCSGTIAAGAPVGWAADGKAISYTPVAGTGSFSLGFAETDGADGNTVYVSFSPFMTPL